MAARQSLGWFDCFIDFGAPEEPVMFRLDERDRYVPTPIRPADIFRNRVVDVADEEIREQAAEELWERVRRWLADQGYRDVSLEEDDD